MTGRLTDPEFLVRADSELVRPMLDAASSPQARLAAAVYRTSVCLHPHWPAEMRRHMLALDAARYGDRELSARIAAVPVQDAPASRWDIQWATGSQVDARFRHVLTGHTSRVSVATVEIDGRPHAITGSYDKTVRVWDLTTGQQVGKPLTGHTDDVTAVATVELEGRPHAVTGGDMTVRVWDLSTGQQVESVAFPMPVNAVTAGPQGHLVVGFGGEIAVLTPH